MKGHRGRYYQKAIPVGELDLKLVHTTIDDDNGDDVDDVDDVDNDNNDDEVDDEDKDVQEWGGRWRECDAFTPRAKKNNLSYLIMY